MGYSKKKVGTEISKKIGIISDTHGYLNNRVFDIFSDVDLIIHAGDIGNMEVLVALQSLAPVHAVFGNTDGFEFRRFLKFLLQFEVLDFTFIVTHMPINFEQKNIIGKVIKVFGHTHYAEIKQLQNELLINPGSAGRQNSDGKYSVVLLDLFSNSEPETEIIYFK